MAIQSLTQIKAWFRRGLKPTEGQFWDTWDSFWHKQELIPMNNIDGLGNALNQKGDTQAFTQLAQEINQQFTEIREEISREIYDGLDGIQKTGKLRPVIKIIDPNAESGTTEQVLSTMSSVLYGASKLPVQTLLDRYNESAETHGTMSVTGTAGNDTDSSTTSVVPFKGNNIFNLKNAKAGLEFQINAQITNLEIQAYSTGNRAISILADGIPLAGSPFSVQSGSVIRTFTHAGPLQVGTLSILNTGGGGGVYIADVSFSAAEKSLAPGLPEDANEGDRYIFRDTDEDRIMEWNGEEWIEEDTSIEAIEVNVLNNNSYSYKKIAGRFSSFDKSIAEDVYGLGSAMETAESDIERLQNKVSELENASATEIPDVDLSAALPKSDFDYDDDNISTIVVGIGTAEPTTEGVAISHSRIWYSGGQKQSQDFVTTIRNATSQRAGVMTPLDKQKLDQMPAANMIETATGAQTKANTAQSNAKAYTDEQIAGLEVPQYKAPEALPFIDKTNTLTWFWQYDSAPASPQNVDFDFAAGHLQIDMARGQEGCTFDLNLNITNEKVGDVRYFKILPSGDTQGFGVEYLRNIKVNGVYLDSMNGGVQPGGNTSDWLFVGNLPSYQVNFEEKIFLFEFKVFDGFKTIEIKTIYRQ